ncbi:MAG: hypothetical protein Q9165_006395 [Trypethelium subeluteriae]
MVPLAKATSKSVNKTTEDPSSLYNPFEGQPDNAKQLSETVAEFTKRLPPLTSRPEDVGEWIWIANPHAEKPRSQRMEDFIEAGQALLENYMNHRRKLEETSPKLGKSGITKRLSLSRDDLKQNINELAVDTGVVGGKWMLRPSLEDLPRVWRLVAEAVAEGRLGLCAKVPPEGSTYRSPTDESVVIVYTYDFTDQKDVKRVLQELVNIGLVPQEGSGRPIYYKTDAYTYLGISSENQYNLRASLYTSMEMMKMTPKIGPQTPGKGKKRTLDSYFRTP